MIISIRLVLVPVFIAQEAIVKKFIAIFSVLIMSILIFGLSGAMAKTPQRSPTAPSAELVGTGITYQGYLEDANGPVTDSCDFQFSLYGSVSEMDQIGATQTHTNIWVESGYFTAQNLDFGSGVFQGSERYLEIAVRCPSGSGGYTTLSPRQSLLPAPYALSLPGLYTTPGDEGPNIIGGYVDNNVKDGVFGGTVSGGGVSWGANYVYDHVGTVSGGANNQAGSDDDDFWNADGATVSGGWDNVASAPISTVSGGAGNATYSYAATVGGGQNNVANDNGATIGGGFDNYITGSSTTIAGGEGNAIWWGWSSTIGGGYTNTITADAAVIAGGLENIIEGWGGSIGGGSSNYTGDWVATVAGGDSNAAIAPASTVSGGSNNTASNNEATVAGGSENTADGQGASILGGYANSASGFAATVAGGESNTASGDGSFAGGQSAHANHSGSFVWSDSTGSFSSTGANQFLIDASGGVGIGTNAPGGAMLAVSGSVDISSDLDVGGNYSWQAGENFLMQGAGDFSFDFSDSDGNDDWHVWSPGYGTILTVQNDGKVGVSNANPNFKLDVNGDINFSGDLYQNGTIFSGGDTTCKWSGTDDIYYMGGNVGIGEMWPEQPLHIRAYNPYVLYEDRDGGNQWLTGVNTVGSDQYFIIYEQTGSTEYTGRLWTRNDGTTGVSQLLILGGSDFAEPFDIYGSENIIPGMVVSIDPEHPGQLRLTENANDHMVAGCVSGANGVNPGLVMSQEGTQADGEFPVALSGRVYCWADASYGAIQPGDLLTTSDTPGHLMVVKDHDQAQGAIVGKAMESLNTGQALILILATLQ